MIEGNLINLRPVIREDLELLKRWTNDITIMTRFNFFGYRSADQLEQNFDKYGVMSEENGRFMIVEKNGTPIGDLGYRAVHQGPGTASRAYNIGIMLLPESRGHGYGVEAQHLLAGYLFSVFRVERVEASTDIENIPEQRALEKAGFIREGVMRHSQFREGRHQDMVLYSLLRDEWVSSSKTG